MGLRRIFAAAPENTAFGRGLAMAGLHRGFTVDRHTFATGHRRAMTICTVHSSQLEFATITTENCEL